MSIKTSTATAAHLNTKGNVIQTSATFEVHLTGSDLAALGKLEHPEGIPGIITEAITEAMNGGRRCRWTGAGCMTSQDLQVAAYRQDEERQSRARSER